MAYDNSINIDIFNSNGDHEPMMKPPLEDHDNGGGGSPYYLYIVASSGTSSGSATTFNENQIYNSDETNNDYYPTGSGISFGHAFLVIENKSSNSISVGDFLLGGQKTLTIGLWMENGVNRPHGGIWYNLENHKANINNEMDDAVALKKNINQTELDIISGYLLDDSNDYYDLVSYNCTHFATNIWNSISNVTVTNQFGFPSSVKSSILSNSSYINYTFSTSFDSIGYFDNGIFTQVTNPI